LVAQKLTIVPFNSQSPSKESLLLLKSYWPKTADKKVGVIGFPLSGKTSLIKSLLKENDISFDFSESLLSIPGIIFSQTTKSEHSARVLLRNYKNSAHVITPLLTVEALISRFSRDQLSKAFQVPFYIDSADLLVQYARKNQYLRRV
jgi:ribosome biogenesis GTPase A